MTNGPPSFLLPGGRVLKFDESNGGTDRSQQPGYQFLRPLNSLPQYKGAVPKQADYQLYLDMYHRHPVVWAAINKIAKVATNTGYDFVPRDKRATVNQAEFDICQKFFRRQHDFVGELRRIYRDLMIFGDAYLYIVYDRRKRPVRLKRLAPWTIHIASERNGNVRYYVQHDPADPAGDGVIFQPWEMVHFKIDDPESDIYGLSPLESLKNTVTTDLFATNWNKGYFKNGASTGTIIIMKDATQDEVDRARQFIKENHSGTDNAHVPIVVTGDVDVKSSVATHQEMGFLEGRNFIKKEILAVLDVPPAKLGDMETANRSNSAEQDKTFRIEAVSPLQAVVEGVLNDQFIRTILKVNDTVFQHSQADVRDAQEQMDLWKAAVQNGMMAINEVRGMMGYADVEGGDIPWVMTPTGAVPVNELPLYYKLPKPNTDKIPVAAHPGTPENNQEPDIKPDVETGMAPTSTKANPNASLIGLGAWLPKALTDESALRQSYAFSYELSQSFDHGLAKALHASLDQAVAAPNPILKQAYIERAVGYLHQLCPSDTEDDTA